MNRNVTIALAVLVASHALEAFSQQSCTPAPDGLIAWWPGDGSGRDVVGTNNGILAGGATASGAGVVRSSFTFDGSSSFVQVPDAPALRPANLTVEGWVRFSSLDSTGNAPVGRQYIIFRQNSRSSSFEGFVLNKERIGGLDYLVFGVTSATGADAEVQGNIAIATNVWYHVAGIRGANFLQLFINGQLQGQASVTFPQDYGNQPLYFGSSGQAFFDRKFAGQLDEVSLYNRALSAGEIAGIFAAGALGKCKEIVITTQPVSQTVAPGASVNLSVAATGFSPITYRWLLNGVAVSGATGTTFSIPNAQPANNGGYSVVLSNSLGAVTSSVAVLTVISAPVITGQPQSRTNIAGTTGTFTVSASGTSLSYQWRKDGSDLSGASTSSLVLPSVAQGHAGSYSVVVSNAAGTVTSTPASLVVIDPPLITSQPQSRTNVAGTTASFSVSATGTALGYQWRRNGVALSGATQSTLILANVSQAQAGTYNVSVSNLAGTLTSTSVTLLVLDPPIISAPPQSRTNVVGTTATFAVVSSGSDLNYRWSKDGLALPWATTPSLEITNVMEFHAGTYSVTVSNSAGSISAHAALTVWVPPRLLVGPQDTQVDSGGTLELAVSVSGTTPFSYQWSLNGTSLPGATRSTYTREDMQLTDQGIYAVSVSNVAGSTNASASVAVAGLVIQGPSMVALGSDAALRVEAGHLAYQWYKDGVEMTGATSHALYLRDVTEDDQATYHVGVGAVISLPAVLTVVSSPVIDPDSPLSRTNLPGSDTVFMVDAHGVGLSFQWQKNQANLADSESVEGANSPVLHIKGITATDAGDYRVLVSNSSGTAISRVATLTVPDPYIVTQPVSVTRTLGSVVCLSVVADGSAPLQYQWRRGQFPLADGNRVTGARSGTLVLDDLQLGDAGDYSVVVQHGAGAVTSAVATVSVVPYVIFADPRLETAVRCALSMGDTGLLWPSNLHGLSCLSAADRGISSLVGLEFATNLSRLVLSGNQISEIRYLHKLTALQDLDLSRNRIEDLDPLGELTNLTCLIISQNEITNHAALSNLSNLTRLTARAGNLSDLRSLQTLRKLSHLTLWENGIEDLAPLSELTNLACLDVRWNAITSLGEFTETHANLTHLYLSGNPLTNVPPLQDLRKLALLNLDECYLESLSPLEGLTNISYLTASRNLITDFSTISTLTGLRGLELRGSKLENVDFLASLPQLKYVDLAYNQLENVDPLSGKVDLSLVLDGNTNLNVSSIEGLTGISRLWLNGTGITNLQFLSSIPQLTALGLEANGIRDFSALGAFPDLELLDLSDNQVTDLSFLETFTKLNALRLNKNQLSGLSSLGTLHKLQFLSVNQNTISSVSPLTGLTNLQSFYAQRNRLDNDQVSLLSLFPNLRHAHLGYNLIDPEDPGIAELRCRRVGPLTCGCDQKETSSATSRCAELELSWIPRRLPPRMEADSHHYAALGESGTFHLEVWDDVVWDDPVSVNAISLNSAVIRDQDITIMGKGLERTLVITNLPSLGQAFLQVTALNEAGLAVSTNISITVLEAIPLADMVSPGGTLDPLFASSLAGTSEEVTSINLLNTTSLEFRGNPDGFVGWAWLSNAPALSVDATGLTDLGFLTNLPSVVSLQLNNITSADLDVLGKLASLTNLVIEGNAIIDIGFLRRLTGLRSVGIHNTQVVDFSPLTDLPNLAHLALSENNIVDIGFLVSMPQLIEVSLIFNRLRDISPVSELRSLRRLSLQHNYLTSLSPLLSTHDLVSCDVALNLLNFTEPVNAAVYRALMGKGTTFTYVPQREPPGIDVRTNWYARAGSPSSITFRIDDTWARDEMFIGATSSNPGAIPAVSATAGVLPYYDLQILAGSGGVSLITLSATNDAGLSSNVVIRVTAGPFFSLNSPGVLNNPGLFWPTIEPQPWFGQNWMTHDGIAAAQSGAAGDFQTSSLATAISGPGKLDFWWRISSETNFDWLQLQVNGMVLTQISGEVEWDRISVPLPPGSNNVIWLYAKDRDSSFGFDAAWVDEVVFTPESQLQVTVDYLNNRLLLKVNGEPKSAYLVEISTNLVNWTGWSTVVLTNESVTIPYTNRPSGNEFFRLRHTQASQPAIFRNPLLPSQSPSCPERGALFFGYLASPASIPPRDASSRPVQTAQSV